MTLPPRSGRNATAIDRRHRYTHLIPNRAPPFRHRINLLLNASHRYALATPLTYLSSTRPHPRFHRRKANTPLA